LPEQERPVFEEWSRHPFEGFHAEDMCGLIFLYQPDLGAFDLKQKARQALQAIQHRGPDDEGILLQPSVVVGHRRLSIIDLAGSHQPLTDATGRYVLAYNGEVYNYKQLRAQLANQWDFSTNGDTEVVLAGLVARGPDFLRQMEGMWALSLWDNEKQQLLLARDRLGKKPLYYRDSSAGFSCASELRALQRLSDCQWEEDLDSTADYLRYGFYLPGTTAYSDVCEVLPGHTLVWSPGQIPVHQPYWSLVIGGFSGSRQQARQAIRETLMEAVEKRLVADVEVGAFLSGGVDSSLIVSILTKHSQSALKTFTIGFTEASYDERKFATQIAGLCNTDHYEECLSSWDAEQLKTLIFDHVGQPFADASLLPTALVSEVAARHVKVALSGDGGDELFSGYQRYQARAIMRWYLRLPAAIRSNIKRVIRAIPEPMAHHSRSLMKKAHLFQSAVERQETETPYVAPALYSRDEFAELAPELQTRGKRPAGLPDETTLDDVQAMMAADASIYLPQDILAKVDRASMAHSLETRAPFLDHKLVELAFSLSRHWHRYGLSGKRILRSSFQDYLPAGIWARRKQGFGVPIHQWFRGDLGRELQGLLEDVDSPLVTSKVVALLAIHRDGGRDFGYRLWNIYIYLLWLQRNK
jgi:asparagine synthase (glutamine-hydrolysing)